MNQQHSQEKIPLLVITGPTASGKTALALSLAERYHGEIISADSMQLYRGMDIATAKPTREERERIPHHLVDCLAPGESFSVADYVTAARRIIPEIHRRGRLPIMAGGTGLYIRSLVDNVEFAPAQADPALRAELDNLWREKGGGYLLAMLAAFDPPMAQTLHPNNKGRLIRAIEIYRQTGVPMSEHLARSRQNPSPYRTLMLGLCFADRDELYRRIDNRVEEMLRDGLLAEAQQMLNLLPRECTAAQAIGHKELAGYLRGEVPLAQAIETIKRETRRYAKRQMTWLRQDKRIHWIEAGAGRTKEEIEAQAVVTIESTTF